MKRGGPLKRSDKPMAAGGLRSANKAETDIWKVLLEQVGCAVCRFVLRIEDTPAEIHHLIDGQRRISHMHVLPLCPVHHRQGIEAHPSRHSVNGCHGGLDIFERTYESEMELVIKCEDWINYPYVTGLLNNEQAPDGDDHVADLNANAQDLACDVESEAVEATALTGAINIYCIHYRFRRVRSDELSIEGIIDGIIKAGLLENSEASQIEAITHRQEKASSAKDERTVVTIDRVAE